MIVFTDDGHTITIEPDADDESICLRISTSSSQRVLIRENLRRSEARQLGLALLAWARDQ